MKWHCKYTRSDIMKEAHRLYKFSKEHFPDMPCQFGECLRQAWEDMRYAAYIEELYEARQEADFYLCFEVLPDDMPKIKKNSRKGN